MILSQVRDYVQQHQRVSLMDAAHHFDTDPDALRGMLDKWVAKGLISKLQQTTRCGGCSKCDMAKIEVYQWLGHSIRDGRAH